MPTLDDKRNAWLDRVREIKTGLFDRHEDKVIIEGVMAGMNGREISLLLGRGYNSVQGRIHRLRKSGYLEYEGCGDGDPRLTTYRGTHVRTGMVVEITGGLALQAEGFDANQVSRAVHGKAKTYAGYKWEITGGGFRRRTREGKFK